MMKFPRRKFLQLAAGAAALPAVSGIAKAQAYPAKPVRIICGFPPGGVNDTYARLIGQWLSERLGQSFIVENRAGAGGTIAVDSVVRALPDGYTLLLTATNDAYNNSLYPELKYVYARDIALIAGVALSPEVMEVNPSVPAKTVPEFIAYAKANPGKLNYASAGVGTMAHLAGALFTTLAGVDINHVPYRGTEQSMIDLMQGRIEILFGTIAPSLPLVRSGKLRALATTGPKRNAMLSDLPTLAESGLAGYEAGLWTGLVFPAGVSPGIVQRLNAEANAVMRDPDVVALLAKQGVEVDTGTPEAFAARIKGDLAKWREVVAKAGIKMQ